MYGLNFGSKDIPSELRNRLRRAKRPAIWRRGAYLVGVAESKSELDQMLVIANNGHRELYVIQIPKLHEYYGVYAW